MHTAFGQLQDKNGNNISPIAFSNQSAVTTSFVAAPQMGGTQGGSSPSGNNQWLKVEFHYGTTPAMQGRYLDSVQFKVWIEGLDPDALNPNGANGKGVAIALTGSVDYVNVPVGKDLYGVIYVHPSTLARYSPENGGYENYDRKYDVHVEAYVGGTLVDAINKNKESDPLGWFKPLKPITGLIYRMDQSPFIMADVDRYPALKLLTPAGQ